MCVRGQLAVIALGTSNSIFRAILPRWDAFFIKKKNWIEKKLSVRMKTFDRMLCWKLSTKNLVVAQLWQEFSSIREWNLRFGGNMTRVFPFLEWRQHQSLRDSSYFFEILGIIEKSTTRRLYGALMAFPMRTACTKQLGPKFPAPTNGVRHFATLFSPTDDISILLHRFYIF